MGYCIHSRNSKFRIDAKNVPLALEAMRRMGNDTSKMKGGAWQNGKQILHNYSWMNGVELSAFRNIEEAMESWAWPVELDTDGNVIGISFEGEKQGQEDLMFEAIAPFVAPGSYVEVVGEDGEWWRWVFRDGHCMVVDGIVTFPEQATPNWPSPWSPE